MIVDSNQFDYVSVKTKDHLFYFGKDYVVLRKGKYSFAEDVPRKYNIEELDWAFYVKELNTGKIILSIPEKKIEKIANKGIDVGIMSHYLMIGITYFYTENYEKININNLFIY